MSAALAGVGVLVLAAALTFGLGVEPAAADPHAFQVVDRLGEDRVGGRADAVRRRVEPLAHSDRKFVVDPAVCRIPHPRIAVFGGDQHIGGTRDGLEILHPPGVYFANRHLLPFAGGGEASTSAGTTEKRQRAILVMR